MAGKADQQAEVLEELRDKSLDDLTDGQMPDVLRGKTPEELQRFVDILDAHLRSLHQTDEGELRELDDAEQGAFDYGMAVREKAIAKIEEHAKIAEVFRRKPKAVEVALSRSFSTPDDPFGDVRRLTTKEARDRALRKLDDRDATGHMSDAQKTQVERTVRRDTDIARRILVTENEDYREAWMKLVTRTHPFLTQEEQRAVEAFEEYRAMAEGGSGSAGGYGVPVFIDPSIILTAQESGNPFLQICRSVTVSTNRWKGVSSAGVSWTFQTEAAVVTDASPTLAQPQVDVNMARGFIPYSIEVGMDYPGFADEMSRLLSAGYDELLVDKFSRGSGTNEPRGIITALDANTNVEVASTTTDGTIVAADVYKVWKSLPQKYRRAASWMMSVDVNNTIRQFGAANLYHAATVDLTAAAAEVLFNKQVYESPYFPDYVVSTGATNNMLVVGDFSNYVIARNGGMSVELVPQLFQQATAGTGVGMPTGQRGWFGYARIGGNSVNDLAFRLLQN